MHPIRVTLVLVGLAILIPLMLPVDRSPVARADEPWAPMPSLSSVEAPLLLPGAPLPPPVRSVRMREYFYRLAEELADACADRHEPPVGRELRLRLWASQIEEGVRAEALPPGDDWRYGALWFWVGHRETRLARRPEQLGSQDGGRAHGPLQVWAWRGMNPYEPMTALDMLVHDPHSWSLPKDAPWTGYPEAASWIAEHPFD